MTFIGALAPIGAAVFMIDQAHSMDRVDLDCQLDILENHLVIMYAACQGDDIQIIVSKTDRNPWLEKFLQAVIHAVDDQGVTVDDELVVWHGSFTRLALHYVSRTSHHQPFPTTYHPPRSICRAGALFQACR